MWYRRFSWPRRSADNGEASAAIEIIKQPRGRMRGDAMTIICRKQSAGDAVLCEEAQGLSQIELSNIYLDELMDFSRSWSWSGARTREGRTIFFHSPFSSRSFTSHHQRHPLPTCSPNRQTKHFDAFHSPRVLAAANRRHPRSCARCISDPPNLILHLNFVSVI